MSSTTPANSRRDEALEHDWLARAERRAGRSGFAEHALARLGAGAAVYGDRWATLGIARLIVELREEAADLGAWGVLALQALAETEGPEASRRRRIDAGLQAAILAGARAHYALGLTCKALTDQRR